MHRIVKKSTNRKVSAKKNLMKIRKNRRSSREKLRLDLGSKVENIFDIQTIIITVFIILLLTYIVKELFFTVPDEIVFDEYQNQNAINFVSNKNTDVNNNNFFEISATAKKAARFILKETVDEQKNKPSTDDMEISRISDKNKSFKLSFNEYRQKINTEHLKDKPVIAIIIDDIGISKDKTELFSNIKYPLTLSFLPYGRNTSTENINLARQNGHEVMLHIPMEAKSNFNEEKNVLKVGMNADTIRKNILTMLDNKKGFVGVNNHMGSKFTSDRKSMEIFMDLIKEKGFLFVDSRTLNSSVGAEIAEKKHVPFAVRDIFIDHVITEKFALEQLAKLEHIAKQKGYAIGIGHPHRTTISALNKWLPSLERNGLNIVPVSYIVERNFYGFHKDISSKISLKSASKNAKNN